MTHAVSDDIAEKLEVAGLWRRASARWLAVMQDCRLTDKQLAWIRQRRIYCQSMLPAVTRERTLPGIAAVSQAATATQKRMGLARTGKQALTITYGSQKKRDSTNG